MLPLVSPSSESLPAFRELTAADVLVRVEGTRDFRRAMTWRGLHAVLQRRQLTTVGELDRATVEAWARHLGVTVSTR
jgi:hypothetical protein